MPPGASLAVNRLNNLTLCYKMSSITLCTAYSQQSAKYVSHEPFCANKRVDLNTYRICYIDNWLRVPITDN